MMVSVFCMMNILVVVGALLTVVTDGFMPSAFRVRSPVQGERLNGFDCDKIESDMNELLSSPNKEELLNEIGTAKGQELDEVVAEYFEGLIKDRKENIFTMGSIKKEMEMFLSAKSEGNVDKMAAVAKSSQEGENIEYEEALGLRAFVKYIINEAHEDSKDKAEEWNTLRILLKFRKEEDTDYFILFGELVTKEKMLEAFDREMSARFREQDCISLEVTFGNDNEIRKNTLSPPWKESELTAVGSARKEDREKLRIFLESKLSPLAGLGNSDVAKPDPTFVDYSPADADDWFTDPKLQADKSYAVVVAGESGSGKSVYACLQAQKNNFHTIYTCMRPFKYNERPKEEETKGFSTSLEDALRQKPIAALPKLNDFLRLLIIILECTKGANDAAVANSGSIQKVVAKLYSMKDRLNVNRNVWAKSVLDAAVYEAVVGMYPEWLKGKWKIENRPEKVAIIVDEATDIDLAEGLVATVQETTSIYLNKLARNRVLLVVAGTGLDLIRYPGRVGTNPALSQLTMMKGPNISNLRRANMVSEEAFAALEEGTFSKVLKTNSRMLFWSVLPILGLHFHQVDGFSGEKKQRRLAERLVDVGSTICLMDHGPRYYVTQNSLGNLTGYRREKLLCLAFLYHLGEAVRGSTKVEMKDEVRDNMEAEIERIDKMKTLTTIGAMRNVSPFGETIDTNLTDDLENLNLNTIDEEREEHTIFNRGLVTRNGTSDALKFLSCFGLSCEVRVGFGNDFEELTALHFMRYVQVQGYETKRISLKYAWPPKNSTNDLSAQMEILRKQKEDESFDLMQGTTKVCYIFSQGTPTAQGADVLALLVDGDINNECELIAIQCKGFSKSPGEQKVRDWWASLGISFENGRSNWLPRDGHASYSLMGLNFFKDLLSEKLQRKVRLGDRILAVAFLTPSKRTNFPIPDNLDDTTRARVWFREMLEPTISLFSLKEAQVPMD